MQAESFGFSLVQRFWNFWPFFFFFFALIYLLFIFCPAARPSSAVLWRAGGGFSSLTNVLEIARRMSMGEHLNLGHTWLWFFFPFFTFFSAVLPDWFIQMKEELLTCFQPGFCLGPQARARHSPNTSVATAFKPLWKGTFHFYMK